MNRNNDEEQLSAKENKRTTLLDIAETVFLDKGYDSATVNDILDAANLSKGGFYYYFKSKNEVLDALRTRYTDWFLMTVESKVAAIPADKMEKRFQTWIYTYTEAYFATYTVHDLVYHSVHTSRANEDRIAIIKSVEQILQDGITQKIWNIADPQFIATVIYSAIHGVTDNAIATNANNWQDIAENLGITLRRLL